MMRSVVRMSSRTVVLTFAGVSSGVVFQHRGMDWGSSDNTNTYEYEYIWMTIFSQKIKQTPNGTELHRMTHREHLIQPLILQRGALRCRDVLRTHGHKTNLPVD